MPGPLDEPLPEFLANREQAKETFMAQIRKAETETHMKLVCRTYANLIGPVVLGVHWMMDAKAIAKMMWNTHSSTQIAFLWGLISLLPAKPPTKMEVN